MSFFVGRKTSIERKHRALKLLLALVLPAVLTSCLSSAEADEWRLRHFLMQNRGRAGQHLEMTMPDRDKNVEAVRNHVIYRMRQDRELQWSLDRYARSPEQRQVFTRRLVDLAFYDERQRVHHQ